MIDNKVKNEILTNIALVGDTSTKVKLIIRGNLNHIINLSSGSPRLQTSIVNKFKLILSQPDSLTVLNPFEIRCALCKKVVSYPCWYYNIRYSVNHFHYFICFDSESPNNPSTRCYRKDV